MAKTRCVLYARVSKSKPGAQDPENQLRQLREFAASQDWQLTHEYVDRESGSKADRAEFLRMLGDASRHQFDVLLFWSLDRFSREGILPTLTTLKRLGRYGVKYRSYRESFLDTTSEIGDLLTAIVAFFADFERKRFRERIMAGLEKARAEGTHLGRPRLLVDKVAVQRLRDQGRSINEIMAAMRLSHGTVQRALEGGV